MTRWLLSLLLLGVLLTAGVSAAPILKNGDRIVIYGDSITEQRMYSCYLAQYLYCRYPDLKLSTYNAGWGGDRAPGGLNRLERDVLVLNPTVVTLFFGMNDGGYRAVTDATIEAYRKGMEGIITALQAKGVQVVVFTPGCVDPDRRGKDDYNSTLEALGKTALELAQKYNCPSMDVIHPMLAYQTAKKAVNPAFTMIPDSVHPDANGHLVMAATMLKGFNVEPMPALGTYDLQANTGEGLKLVTNTPEKIVLETAGPVSTPFYYDPALTQTVTDSGMISLTGQKVTLRGLKEEMYDLTVDGIKVGRVTAEQLAAGYALPGNFSARGKLLRDLVTKKENFYYSAWREYRLPLANMASSKRIVDGMMETVAGFTEMIHELAAPQKMTFTLTPRPASANLAEGMKYDSSDPNTHNWGIGGLTDGSWDADNNHCFASNEGDVFPKTATIDLEKPLPIGSVIAGVPNFGATKTITVSVSADGTNYTEVGTHVFTQKKAERFTYTFAPVTARFVRLTYPDHYTDGAGYNALFVFTTEAEVYAPAK